MAEYLILNITFFAIVYVALRPKKLLHRASLVSAGVLLLLTVIFDNLIIVANIVAYDESKLLGWYIFKAPAEDFFYSLLAVMMVPALWKKYTQVDESNE